MLIAWSLRAAADQLEAAFRANAQDSLTLAEAERESGYSRQHLARMVRKGTLTNVGRPRSPRVRRGDLPRKPRRLALRSESRAGNISDVRGRMARAIAHSTPGATDGTTH
jgi:hypothetical protein